MESILLCITIIGFIIWLAAVIIIYIDKPNKYFGVSPSNKILDILIERSYFHLLTVLLAIILTIAYGIYHNVTLMMLWAMITMCEIANYIIANK